MTTFPGGLTVVSEARWTGVALDDGFTDTFCVLGERIFVSRPQGHATDLGIERAFDVVHEVIATAIPPTGPFVWIADYSALDNASRTTRRRFARRMAEFERLHSLILCGLSPSLRVAARMARLVHILEARVHVVDSFEEGLELAVDKLAPYYAGVAEAQVEPVVVAPDWHLDLDGLSASWAVVAGDELHCALSGVLDVDQVDPVMNLQEEVLVASGLAAGRYFLVDDLSALERIGYRARRRLVDRLTAWHQTSPFSLEVAFGANQGVRAAFNLSRAFAPFEAVIVDGAAAARRLVDAVRATGRWGDALAVDDPAVVAEVDEDLDPYADELVRAIGAVTWGVDGMVGSRDPDHPFRTVFEAIEVLRQDLDEILAERARFEDEQRDLQHRLDQARKMEALGLLAAGVAHDLNNALSGVVTYPEVLLMDPSLPANVREALENVHEYGRAALAVVDDLVSATGGVVDVRIAVDLAATVTAVSCEVAGETERRGVAVTLALDGGLLPVMASPVRLRRVVRNLLAAALAAAPNGTGRVRVEARNFYADQTLRRLGQVVEGEYVVLAVTDNGSQVPDADRERLFEPFYAKKRLGRGGTGLGLTAVWSSVHADGGSVDVCSSAAETRFEVYLPVARADQATSVGAVAAELGRGDGERVLVVDDVELQRTVACAILTALGYAAEAVASGEEAIARLQREAFDLILLDMVMDPGIGGRETLQRLRRFRPELPAVVASGQCAEDDLAAVLALGHTAFLRKPYTVAELAARVRAGLDGASSASA